MSVQMPPWSVYKSEGKYLVLDSYGVEVGSEGLYDIEDACLISASPDLLLVTECALDWIGLKMPDDNDLVELIALMRAAIIKAKGTS